MMDAVTYVAIVSDENKVNCAAIFGDHVFCRESIRLSLEHASKEVAEKLKQRGSVRLERCQLVIDGTVFVDVNTSVRVSLEDYLSMLEQDVCDRWSTYAKAMVRYQKEV